MVLKLKLKGGALYIALIISIVIGIILSVFILIAYFNQRQVLSRLALTQLKFNLNSGLSMAASANFSEQTNNKWQSLSNLYEDSVRIKKMQWGAYEVITVESKNRMHCLKEAALYGTQTFIDTAILLADRGRPIGLSGKITVKGGCYFPKAGYKPVDIEGQSLNSDGSLTAFMRQAPAHVPPVNGQLKSALKKSLTEFNPNTDSLITALPPNLSVDFFSKTALLRGGTLLLSNQKLYGNIRLIANEVTIRKDCDLKDLFIIATRIRIEAGFKGSIHILAMDSIIAEEGCVFDYPSSLTVLNDRPSETRMKGIYLGPDCRVSGAVICLGAIAESPVIVKLNANSEIYGLVYSSKYAQAQGKVFGTVFCESLLLSTPSTAYENTIANCQLDSKKFGHSLVVPFLFQTNITHKCCKWL